MCANQSIALVLPAAVWKMAIFSALGPSRLLLIPLVSLQKADLLHRENLQGSLRKRDAKENEDQDRNVDQSSIMPGGKNTMPGVERYKLSKLRNMEAHL